MQDTQTLQKTNRKTLYLTASEKKALRKYRASFKTDVECAENIGITPQVMGKVLFAFKGAPETIELIRKAIAA